jgi:hypothetical protein
MAQMKKGKTQMIVSTNLSIKQQSETKEKKLNQANTKTKPKTGPLGKIPSMVASSSFKEKSPIVVGLLQHTNDCTRRKFHKEY